jgi:hypothetical protein
VARLFDKDPPTARPDTLPLPYSNENPPPWIRITVLLLTFSMQFTHSFVLLLRTFTPIGRLTYSYPMRTMSGRMSPLVMMPEVTERLRLRPSLLIRSDPAQRGKPTPHPPIRLFPPLHQLAARRKSALCLGPSTSTTRLRMIR